MNLEEIIMASISEFLDIDVNRETETLDLAAKIEIVQKKLINKTKKNIKKSKEILDFSTYEYEMFFKSNPNDIIKIDGWIPIKTDKISEIDKISRYIEIGLLRELKPVKETDNE